MALSSVYASIRPQTFRSIFRRSFSSTLRSLSYIGPNAPLDLDPSLQQLLKDVDLSLLKHSARAPSAGAANNVRELEVIDRDEEWVGYENQEETEYDDTAQRKSVTASFGSHQIGSVVLPTELQQAIERIIEEQNKPLLHQDAKRLFFDEKSEKEGTWHTNYDVHYKSRIQFRRQADADGTAFASIALPAHYAAISAVFHHLKHRLGPDWTIDRVFDWGCGAGSGIWALMHAFQSVQEEPLLSKSSILSYLAIDKRDGLVRMAKRLVEGSVLDKTSLTFRRGFLDSDPVLSSESDGTLALSSFYLSSLPTPLAKKDLVRQMWFSGAGTIVLIDHDSPEGFQSIADAREYLLRLGHKKSENLEIANSSVLGCHVVAPCPHDGACPLHVPGVTTPTICSFSQRLQRPTFLRRTKHARTGHEDVGYSYVVIRRGIRPSPSSSVTRSQDTQMDEQYEEPVDRVAEERSLEEGMRSDAYQWPRLVFPPLKRSGHVIMDSCTHEGNIVRMTIPRSQGKQPYYDARKSSWGDLFPHAPKNPPQVRILTHPDKVARGPSETSDIGKSKIARRVQSSSYTTIVKDLKKGQKRRRRQEKLEDESVI